MLRLFDLSGKFALVCGLVLAAVVPLTSANAKFRVLYSFKGGNDGAYPRASLIQDSAHNFYGTTELGGAKGQGTVFKLAPDGTETVLYAFCQKTNCADGAGPAGGLIEDAQGNLYGTTHGGGLGYGTVFELAPDGGYTAYAFTGGNDGNGPAGSLIMDQGTGSLYGTTFAGGPYGQGTVFELSFGIETTETVLYAFSGGGGNTDGNGPLGSLMIMGGAYNYFYGTTAHGGGTGCSGYGCGTIFKVFNGGETPLHAFTGYDGAYPAAGLITDAAGNLYGTTQQGDYGYGNVFELAPDGTLTVLHVFKGGSDGAYSSASLITDGAGNLYGITGGGGGTNCGGSGCGTVFKLAPDGTETVLHAFKNKSDGGYPEAGLIADKKGHLYGTSTSGGTNGYGTVFKLNE